MAVTRTCDRCTQKILDGAQYQQVTLIMAGPMPDQFLDLCPDCYGKFGRFMEGDHADTLTAPLPGDPGDCPHGSAHPEPCLECRRRVCNLCGLYAAGGNYYCADHRPAFALQAKGIFVDTARG